MHFQSFLEELDSLYEENRVSGTRKLTESVNDTPEIDGEYLERKGIKIETAVYNLTDGFKKDCGAIKFEVHDNYTPNRAADVLKKYYLNRTELI